ncbi:MAG: cytochrome P450 [Okeania sp. SIO2D1]|uniref:cytochrome P450 n=1 Tax=Okeania sp. SIO2C9 TaxID=2607791 RepID=UPI0013BC6994|nr:cytochrome P450 [Okeania sp. SIO2C9]NEQ74804.1 cytochrome P450 [Okeania sp. SIO2C9]NES68779.1 cytochrome P450 [Okeania sp. SIO2D1]
MQTLKKTEENTHPLPPGSFGLPLIGETLDFLRDRNFADRREQKYGTIFKTHILGRPTIVMIGPEANRFILHTHFDHFSWRDGWPKNFHELLGRSLFLQEGEEHQRNRRLLMPAFHGQALRNYFATMVDIINRYLVKWSEMKHLTLLPEMKQMTFEVASILLLGSKPGTKTALLSQKFSELSAGFFALPIRLPFTTYTSALKARDFLLNHIEAEIREREKNPTQDALSLLIQTRDEEGNSLSLEEIKVQALLMLFAGHETTTSMFTSLCMALAQHPDILAQAKAEQEKLKQQGELSNEQLKQMPYLEQVLKEVERLYPPVGGGFRGVVKPFTYNGYYVPQGWQVLYRIERTHQDQRVYTNPSEFDPERFHPERAEDKKMDYSLVGFGGGSRFCLGYAFAQMEIKIFASLLLRNYQWKLEPNQDLSLTAIPSLHPRSGLKILMMKNSG